MGEPTVFADYLQVLHLVSDLGANTDVQDVEGDSALHDAARFGHLGCITVLVESGADSTLKNKKGQTAAAVAEEYGQAEAVALCRTLPKRHEQRQAIRNT